MRAPTWSHTLTQALPAPALFQATTLVPAHVVVGTSARVFGRVRRPGVNLAVWLRPSPRWDPPPFQLRPNIVAVDEVFPVGVPGLGKRAVPADLPPDLRRMVGQDVERLTRALGRLVPLRHVRVKLSACDGDECRLFHVDHVVLRLITTYYGPGTDWLEEDAVRRAHLGGRGLPRGTGIAGINNAIVADWTRVHRLPRLAVAAFRGSQPLKVGDAVVDAPGIVHRSPPIAGTGIVRLRLVVEPPDPHSACDASCAG